MSRTARLLVAYSKEMRALSQLYCLADFKGAIEGLLESGLYREAIVLARVNMASDDFVHDLHHRWSQARLAQGNYEGAIKCLVAANRVAEAIQLLEQRRALCSDMSASTVLKQYDEVIELLRSQM